MLASTSRRGHLPHPGLWTHTCEAFLGELSYKGEESGHGQSLGLTHGAMLQLGTCFCVSTLATARG